MGGPFPPPCDTPPHSFKDSNASPKVETMKEEGIGVHSLACNTLGVEGHVEALGWGLGWMISGSIIHKNLHKPNNKLVSAWLEHFCCIDKPRAYIDSQDSSRFRLRGGHYLPPYSILYACPWGLHPYVVLSQDFEIGTLATLQAHNVLWKPSIEVRFKEKL